MWKTDKIQALSYIHTYMQNMFPNVKLFKEIKGEGKEER
jgi:hypothetical protein